MSETRAFLRSEALPLTWADLDESQRKALERLVLMLAEESMGPYGEPPAHSAADVWTPWLDYRRKNRVAFLSGPRGSGKTTVLLTLLRAFRQRVLTPSNARADQQPSEDLKQEFNRLLHRVFWLEPLDMDPLPKAAHLFSAILARIESAVERWGRGSDRSGGYETARGLLEPEREYDLALAALHQLETDVALSWEGNLSARAGHLEPGAFAREVMQAEHARLALNERLHDVLDRLARDVFQERAERRLLFVLPVDDFDLNPVRCLQLLDLLRTITVPRLFFIVLGDEAVAEVVLNLQTAADLARVAGNVREREFLPVYPGEVAALAARVAGEALKKLLPAHQRVLLEGMKLTEALRFAPHSPQEARESPLPTLETQFRACPLPLANRPEAEHVTNRDVNSLLEFLLVPPLPIHPAEGRRRRRTQRQRSSSEQEAFTYQAARLVELPPRHLADLWYAFQEVVESPEPSSQLLPALRKLCRDAMNREPAMPPLQRRRFTGQLSLDPQGEWIFSVAPFVLHAGYLGEQIFRMQPLPAGPVAEREFRIRPLGRWALRVPQRQAQDDPPTFFAAEETTNLLLLYTDLLTLSDADVPRNFLLDISHDQRPTASVTWVIPQGISMRLVWPLPPMITFWEYDLFMGGWRLAFKAARSLEATVALRGLAFLWIDLGAAVLLGDTPTGLLPSLAPGENEWKALATRLESLFNTANQQTGGFAERVREWLTNINALLAPQTSGEQVDKGAAFRDAAPRLCASWGGEKSYPRRPGEDSISAQPPARDGKRRRPQLQHHPAVVDRAASLGAVTFRAPLGEAVPTMAPIRLTGIPIDHVVAELVAFPLASEAAFGLVLTQLDPAMLEPTGGLWRQFERDALPALRGFSLDEIIAVRDRVWFGGIGGEEGGLHAYLKRQAEAFLLPRGDNAVPRAYEVGGPDATPMEQGGLVEGRRRWRWLTFALPPDLLLAGLGLNGPTAIETLSPSLATQLRDQGFAETHLHVGAALRFSDLWAAVLHRLSRSDCTEHLFASPGAVFSEGAGLAPWLLRGALARLVLAAYLTTGSRSGLEPYLRATVYPRVATRVGAAYAALLRAALCELRLGRLWVVSSPHFTSLRLLYARMTGLEGYPLPEHLSDVDFLDPLAGVVGHLRGRSPAPEVAFCRLALHRIKDGPPDRFFTDLFWQVVRLRCLFYRHVVQRPMTPGLPWFIRFFDRLRPARGAFGDRLRVQSALRVCGWGEGLRSLEIRTAPDESEHHLLALFRNCREAAVQFARLTKPAPRGAGITPCEFGLVLHFIKERSREGVRQVPRAHGLLSHADPNRRVNPTPFRYSQFFSAQRRQARALAAALRTDPSALEFFRGLDICSEEQGIPNWVFLPLFKEVRQAAQAASIRLFRLRGRPAPPLRTTIHVGEDFLHPQTGLRCIADAIHFFDLREGDRLGHAMALGVDVEDWCRRAGRVALTREDRLFDLLWEWDWRSQRDGAPAGRCLRLEREIDRLCAVLFGPVGSRGEFLRLRHVLHDGAALRRIGYPDRGTHLFRPPEAALNVLWYFLADPGVFRRGREIEWIDPSEEGEALAKLQAEVRREVGRRGLTVEVNPSSNLLIGDFGALDRHPIWRFSPPISVVQSVAVPVCFGSDDPITFATSTREEYQIVHDALISAGVSPETALQWIDEVRANGMRARFTVPPAIPT